MSRSDASENLELSKIEWDRLANTIVSSLEIVSKYRVASEAPSVENERVNDIVRRLATESAIFTRAVEDSVGVAESGQGICTSIIKYINEKGIDGRSRFYTEEECVEFRGIMQQEANKALKGAREMHRSFRDIRSKILGIAGDILKISATARENIQVMTTSQSAEPRAISISNVHDELRTASDQVNEALSTVDQLVEWWQQVKSLTQNLDTGSLAQISSNPKNQLFLLLIKSTWEDLHRQYTEYIDKVNRIIDEVSQTNQTSGLRAIQKESSAPDDKARNVGQEMPEDPSNGCCSSCCSSISCILM